MTWENQMALDMTLAQKRGVCVLIGGECCTYIPNNTSPYGIITKALQGLTALLNGMNDPFTKKMIQKMEGVMASILPSFIVVFGGPNCNWGLYNSLYMRIDNLAHRNCSS
jgi:hypothetical protein